MLKNTSPKRRTYPHAATFALRAVFTVKREKDRPPMEYAKWLKKAVKKYPSTYAAAKALNIGSVAHIINHLRLNEMPAEVRKMLSNNVLAPSIAYELLYEFPDDIRIHLAKHAVKHGFGRIRLNRYANMYR